MKELQAFKSDHKQELLLNNELLRNQLAGLDLAVEHAIRVDASPADIRKGSVLIDIITATLHFADHMGLDAENICILAVRRYIVEDGDDA